MLLKFVQSDALWGHLEDRYVPGEALLLILLPAGKPAAEGLGFLE